MKISIRTKFNIGILFLFVIILVISVFSAFYLNRMSKKTSAILKENHVSVSYAREMSEGLLTINQEITNSFLTNKNPDKLLIDKGMNLFGKSLQLEKNTITEAGEDQLVASITAGFATYCDSLAKYSKSPKPVTRVLYLQDKFSTLYQQLMLLSRINEKAIEVKTNDAKDSAKMALRQMTILGTLCFLFALSFTFRFATYFNERFFQLFNGIKEINASNFGQRLHFDGKDEFYDISLVFNEMAEKLSRDQQKLGLTLLVDNEKENSLNDILELKRLLSQIISIENEAKALISRIENKI
jgi:two-component system, NtrC family, sensor histidine kinase KinB